MAGRTVEEHNEYLNSQPFFGKIKEGDWVRAKIVHSYQTPAHDKSEIIGICVRVYGDGHLLHIQDAVYQHIKTVDIENIIDARGAE